MFFGYSGRPMPAESQQDQPESTVEAFDADCRAPRRRGYPRCARPLGRRPLRNAATDDQGKEMAEHERLAQRFAIRVFYADPYSSWQRGTHENTN